MARFGRGASPRGVRLFRPAGGVAPAQILNIGSGAGQNHFDLQMTRSSDGASTLQTMPLLQAGYQENPYFVTNSAGTAVRFQVEYNAPIVGGGAGPRSELREVDASDTNAAWDALSGDHTLHGRTKVTRADSTTVPDIVVAQLHNGTTDRIALRTQLVSGTLRLRLRINGSSVTVTNTGTLDLVNPYVYGTEFEWKVRVYNGGAVDVYYNNMATPVYSGATGTLVTTGSASWYWKAGCYAQTTDVAGLFAATELRDLIVSTATPLADTGTAVDALITSVRILPLSDTVTTGGFGTGPFGSMVFGGGGSDTLTAATSGTTIPVTDTGSGADALTVTAKVISLAETGAAADAVTVAAVVPLADTGTGTQALSAGVPLALAETGSGADALTVPAKVISLADTGTGVDALFALGAPIIAPGTLLLASSDLGEVDLDDVPVTGAAVASFNLGTVVLASSGAGVATVQT